MSRCCFSSSPSPGSWVPPMRNQPRSLIRESSPCWLVSQVQISNFQNLLASVLSHPLLLWVSAFPEPPLLSSQWGRRKPVQSEGQSTRFRQQGKWPSSPSVEGPCAPTLKASPSAKVMPLLCLSQAPARCHVAAWLGCVLSLGPLQDPESLACEGVTGTTRSSARLTAGPPTQLGQLLEGGPSLPGHNCVGLWGWPEP